MFDITLEEPTKTMKNFDKGNWSLGQDLNPEYEARIIPIQMQCSITNTQNELFYLLYLWESKSRMLRIHDKIGSIDNITWQAV